MSFLARLSVLTFLSATFSAYGAPTTLVSRQAPAGSTETGYSAMPELEGATLHTDWEMKGSTFPLYLTTATTEGDTSAVKRAVIVPPGKLRDCWSHWTIINDALKNYADVDDASVSIMAPCFLTDLDVTAGAASASNIVFGLTTWVSGHENTAPADISISAYEVVDELINYYLDATKFPALEAIVFAGHSAGSQMTQRYAALRSSTDNDAKIHYYVANPGSFVWLSEDRPVPNDACEGVDSFKYGLGDNFPAYAASDASALQRQGLIDRYMGRKIHYAFGLADTGAGDTRCQALTQGASHLERGQNFMTMVDGLGGLGETSTVDYIEGVSHDGGAMFNSAEGLDKLFKFV